MATARITDIAGTPGIELSPEVLRQLNATIGDDIQVIAEDGEVTLRKLAGDDADTQQQMQVAEQVMDERREVLRRLAE